MHADLLNRLRLNEDNMKRYFSRNDQHEFELHDTLEEAKAAAEQALEDCRDEAIGDGWSESVDDICYGVLLGAVVETERKPWNVEDFGSPPNGEEDTEYVEYALT